MGFLTGGLEVEGVAIRGGGRVGPTGGMVRILGLGGSSAGAGFVVLRQDGAAIVTCAHVVDAAVDETDAVAMVFVGSADRSPRMASVDRSAYRAATAEDVAFLSLDEPMPSDVSALPLATSLAAVGRTFHTFGFSSAKSLEGLAGEVRIIGETTEGGFRVLQVRSNEVSSGFSGAPVWDEEGHVIGVVVSTIAAGADAAGKQIETSFLIPVETLLDIKPELRPTGISPYRGLDVFEEEHERWYFGREESASKLVELLAAVDFVAVIGVSGSGKSSLVRAGLKQALDRTPVPGVGERRRLTLKPSREPLLDLVAAVGDEVERDAVAELDDATLIERLRSALGHSIVIIDQFERLYTECDDAAVRVRFIDVLLALAERGIKIVITLRADFYGHALEHTKLAGKIEAGQLTLLPMTEEELARAIVLPARALNRAVEDELVDRLVADVTGRAGDLPLLEFALTQLWESDAEHGVLTKSSYEAIGYRHPDGRTFSGVQGAIAKRAQDVWSELGPEGQTAARSVIVALIAAAGPSGDASVSEATRRALQSELDPDSSAVIDTLVDARLLTTGRDARDQPTVGVAHDALIRAWPLAQTWAREYRPFIRWRVEKLLPYWQDWLDHDERKAFLLPGPAVEEALDWLAKYPDEIGPAGRYIKASEKAIASRVRRLYVAGAILFAITLGAVAATILAVDQSRRANRERSQAEAQRNIALSNQLAAQASAPEVPYDTSLLLAAEAYRIEDTAEALSALVARLQANPLLDRYVRSERQATFAAFSTDGRMLVTDGEGTVIRDSTTGSPLAPPVPVSAEAGRFTPDGRFVIVAGYDGSTARIAARAGTVLKSSKPDQRFEFPTAAAVSPDGRAVAFANDDGRVLIRDASTGRRLGRVLRFGTSFDRVESLALGHGGVLAVGLGDGSAIVVDGATGERPHRRPPIRAHGDEPVGSVAFSPDGRLLAIGGWFDQRIVLVRLRDRQILGRVPVLERISSIAFSPDSRTLAWGDWNGHVGLWDVEGGESLGVLDGHLRFAGSPTSRSAVTASAWSASARTGSFYGASARGTASHIEPSPSRRRTRRSRSPRTGVTW